MIDSIEGLKKARWIFIDTFIFTAYQLSEVYEEHITVHPESTFHIRPQWTKTLVINSTVKNRGWLDSSFSELGPYCGC